MIVDHMLHIPAGQGVRDKSFQSLLRLVGEGHVHVKLSAPYRLSDRFPDYPDVRPFHEALLRATAAPDVGDGLPHPSIPGEIMPDDGQLLNLSVSGRLMSRCAAAFSSRRRRACRELGVTLGPLFSGSVTTCAWQGC